MTSEISRHQAHIGGAASSASPVVFLIEDDPDIRESLRDFLEIHGQAVEDFETCESFLDAFNSPREACLLLDVHLRSGMSGLDLLLRLNEIRHAPPVVVISGTSNIQMAVQVMKAGAMDFIQKPFRCSDILSRVDRALVESRKRRYLSELASVDR